jgi:hypothetical protein
MRSTKTGKKEAVLSIKAELCITFSFIIYLQIKEFLSLRKIDTYL